MVAMMWRPAQVAHQELKSVKRKLTAEIAAIKASFPTAQVSRGFSSNPFCPLASCLFTPYTASAVDIIAIPSVSLPGHWS